VQFKLSPPSKNYIKNSYLCTNQTNKKYKDMTREEFLSMADSYYADFEALNNSSTFYDYEKSFVALWQQFGKSCMEKQLNASSSTEDRRKKKRLPDLERFPY
jgi:hypothetical protein